MTVTVERPVYEAIEEVRREGKYNMLNVDGVLAELTQKARNAAGETVRYDHAVVWLTDNQDTYATAIFEGIEPETETDDDR